MLSNKIRVKVDDVSSFTVINNPSQFEFIKDEILSDSPNSVVSMNLEDYAMYCLNEIKKEHARLLDVLSGNQSIEERDTWPVKAQFVDHFANGTKEQKVNAEKWLTKMLKKGEKLSQYVAKIQAGINGNMELMTTAEGLKRNAEMAIDAAKSVEELEATMDAIKAQSKGAETAFKKALAAAA